VVFKEWMCFEPGNLLPSPRWEEDMEFRVECEQEVRTVAGSRKCQSCWSSGYGGFANCDGKG